jgi:hypothetical protein
MSATINRAQKIAFAEMPSSGVRGVLIYCADYRCRHHVAVTADQWSDDLRLSDIESRFVCAACVQDRANSTNQIAPQVRAVSHATVATPVKASHSLTLNLGGRRTGGPRYDF